MQFCLGRGGQTKRHLHDGKGRQQEEKEEKGIGGKVGAHWAQDRTKDQRKALRTSGVGEQRREDWLGCRPSLQEGGRESD